MAAATAARTRQLSWRAKSGGPLRWCGFQRFPGRWRFCAKDTAGWRRTAVARRRSVLLDRTQSDRREAKEAVMRSLLVLLWLAGLVQVAIASANLFLPAKLKYRENLSRVSPIIRQIFVVHMGTTETIVSGEAQQQIAAATPRGRLRGWIGWVPLIAFPVSVMALRSRLLPWVFMWLL